MTVRKIAISNKDIESMVRRRFFMSYKGLQGTVVINEFGVSFQSTGAVGSFNVSLKDIKFITIKKDVLVIRKGWIRKYRLAYLDREFSLKALLPVSIVSSTEIENRVYAHDRYNMYVLQHFDQLNASGLRLARHNLHERGVKVVIDFCEDIDPGMQVGIPFSNRYSNRITYHSNLGGFLSFLKWSLIVPAVLLGLFSIGRGINGLGIAEIIFGSGLLVVVLIVILIFTRMYEKRRKSYNPWLDLKYVSPEKYASRFDHEKNVKKNGGINKKPPPKYTPSWQEGLM